MAFFLGRPSLIVSGVTAPEAIFIAFALESCYHTAKHKGILVRLAVSPSQFPWNVRRAASYDSPSGKEGCPMVSFTDLIQIGILIVGIISLFIQANKK